MRGQPYLMMKIKIGRAMAPMIKIVSRLTAPRSSRWTLPSNLRTAETVVILPLLLHERPANQRAGHLVDGPDDSHEIIIRHRQHRQDGSEHQDIVQHSRPPLAHPTPRRRVIRTEKLSGVSPGGLHGSSNQIIATIIIPGTPAKGQN